MLIRLTYARYRVVAEGIETQAAYDLLREWGCEEGQGYFMAKPMAALQVKSWLKPIGLASVA